jgi:hypothetical protein
MVGAEQKDMGFGRSDVLLCGGEDNVRLASRALMLEDARAERKFAMVHRAHQYVAVSQ